jgi:hypothetical protein
MASQNDGRMVRRVTEPRSWCEVFMKDIYRVNFDAHLHNDTGERLRMVVLGSCRS